MSAIASWLALLNDVVHGGDKVAEIKQHSSADA